MVLVLEGCKTFFGLAWIAFDGIATGGDFHNFPGSEEAFKF